MSPDDPRPPDDFEDRLRRSLRHEGADLDTESFLGDVHRGARGRRRRRTVGGVVATAAVIAAATVGVASTGVFDDDATNAADQTPTVTTTGPTPGPSTDPSTEATPTEKAKRRALSLSATDSDHQYVLVAGTFGCRGNCLRAYTTPDGGEHWTGTAQLGLFPSDPDPTTDTAFGIRFADQDDGWVFGGGLRSTHDGGASWTKPDLPVQGIVTSLAAWGGDVYAAVSDDEMTSTRLVHSSADSDDWQAVDIGGDLGNVTDIVMSKSLVAVLESPTGLSADNQLRVSTDGSSWAHASPCSGRRWPTGVSTSDGALWTSCSDNHAASIEVSVDNGSTWTTVPGDFQASPQLAARDQTTAAAFDGGRGLILVQTGSPPQRVLREERGLLPIGFTNPSTGYVVTSDQQHILRTVDSGATWQVYPLPG